jgi:F0F1-type ATP synthase membrane subunit b/b'
MNKIFEIVSKIWDVIGSDGAYLIVIAFLTFCLWWIYTDNKQLEHELELANANVVTMTKTVEKQNADIEKYKADIRKYNENVVSKVSAIKSESRATTERVKEELKKDNSDTNQLKLIDNILMEFSNGK